MHEKWFTWLYFPVMRNNFLYLASLMFWVLVTAYMRHTSSDRTTAMSVSAMISASPILMNASMYLPLLSFSRMSRGLTLPFLKFKKESEYSTSSMLLCQGSYTSNVSKFQNFQGLSRSYCTLTFVKTLQCQNSMPFQGLLSNLPKCLEIITSVKFQDFPGF